MGSWWLPTFVEYLVVPIWYILQTQVIQEYPAKLIVVFLFNLCGTIISAPGLLCTGLCCLIEIWALHLKGPVYVSMFRPLSVAVAAAMGVIFLREALHLGRHEIRSLSLSTIIFPLSKAENQNQVEVIKKIPVCFVRHVTRVEMLQCYGSINTVRWILRYDMGES
ncbi:hypothetical protein K1719_009083 [Acacia pycnantha]|nr:hypothetical protein K1719_009083 [Acacia pycnantha]